MGLQKVFESSDLIVSLYCIVCNFCFQLTALEDALDRLDALADLIGRKMNFTEYRTLLKQQVKVCTNITISHKMKGLSVCVCVCLCLGEGVVCVVCVCVVWCVGGVCVCVC